MNQDTEITSKKKEKRKKIIMNKESNTKVYRKGIELLLKRIGLYTVTDEDIDNYDVDKEFKLIEQKKSRLSSNQRKMVCRLHGYKKVVLGE